MTADSLCLPNACAVRSSFPRIGTAAFKGYQLLTSFLHCPLRSLQAADLRLQMGIQGTIGGAMANQVSIQTLIHRLRTRLRTFGTATGGNVVMTFALATVPMIGFVGSAVDYSRGNSAKAALQSAIDATGLMLSKEAATLTQSQIDQKASAY